jgi:parvulin-like peptidyl-prolyl isomerase
LAVQVLLPPLIWINPPQLVETTALPPLPTSVVQKKEVMLELKLHVRADGSVDDFIWIASSRNREWDSLAANRILTWKYSPAARGGKNVAVWVRQSIKVVTVDPESLLLAEIVTDDRATADSVYVKLKAGADFEELAREYSTSGTAERGGYMGKVNLSVFPLAIRDRLSQLQEEDFTPPVPLSGNFVIYKRVRRGPVVG